MPPTWMSVRASPRTVACAVSASLLLGLLVVLVLEASTTVTDISAVAFGVVATVLCGSTWRLMRRTQRAAATAWLLVTLAIGVRTAGDAVWAYIELVRDAEPFPSVADIGYIAFFPLVALGLLRFPAARRTRRDRYRMSLDVAMVTVAGCTGLWLLVLGPTIDQAERYSSAVVLNIAYPIGDSLIVVAAASASVRVRDRRWQLPLRILAAASAAFVVGDVVFGHQSLRDNYVGEGWADAAWTVGIVGYGLAAVAQRVCLRTQAADPYSRPSAPDVRRVPVGPYLAVAVTVALLTDVALTRAFYPVGGVVVAAIAVMALVALRQVSLLADNRTLLAAYHRLATVDQLTGMPTRQQFFQLGEELLEQSREDGAAVHALMIDVNRFKVLNDVYGHRIGDRALRQIAQRCRANVRQDDVLFGRYGGDEFVALCFGVDRLGADLIAQRLRDAVAAEPVATDAGPVPVSISVGVACVERGSDLESVLEAADRAMFGDKRGSQLRMGAAE